MMLCLPVSLTGKASREGIAAVGCLPVIVGRLSGIHRRTSGLLHEKAAGDPAALSDAGSVLDQRSDPGNVQGLLQPQGGDPGIGGPVGVGRAAEKLSAASARTVMAGPVSPSRGSQGAPEEVR